MIFAKYFRTARMSAQSSTNGGVIHLFLGYLLKIIYLIPMLLLWRTLIHSGVDAGMSLRQMLAYTYLGAILSEILVVRTPASSWLYEGLFISLYQRPMNVLSPSGFSNRRRLAPAADVFHAPYAPCRTAVWRSFNHRLPMVCAEPAIMHIFGLCGRFPVCLPHHTDEERKLAGICHQDGNRIVAVGQRYTVFRFARGDRNCIPVSAAGKSCRRAAFDLYGSCRSYACVNRAAFLEHYPVAGRNNSV